MKKPVYKLLDEKGRVLIPKELRQMAEMEYGDIVKLSVNGGKISVSRVDIVEAGNQDPKAVEAYINAAVKIMSHEKQVELAARILKFAQQREGEKSC
ncbi:MAG: AbrB/MazE/SpoVT family DNA-binding domain-containing protein [Lachnospiraceae bacterium]|nr:AbrB/MazE/SpoVT family DNA-binding domain-containing protein [Lachnospiraceae bacterium]